MGLVGNRAIARLLVAASHCDGIAKGLVRPDWPEDPWDALRRLALMTLHFTRGRAGPRGGPGLVLSA